MPETRCTPTLTQWHNHRKRKIGQTLARPPGKFLDAVAVMVQDTMAYIGKRRGASGGAAARSVRLHA